MPASSISPSTFLINTSLLSVNDVKDMYAVSSSSFDQETVLSSTFARTMSKLSSFSSPALLTLSETLVASSPWIRLAASSIVSPARLLSPTAVIMSNAFMPAFSAGEPDKTPITAAPLLTALTRTPIPRRDAVSAPVKFSYCSLVKYLV